MPISRLRIINITCKENMACQQEVTQVTLTDGRCVSFSKVPSQAACEIRPIEWSASGLCNTPGHLDYTLIKNTVLSLQFCFIESQLNSNG